MSGTLPPKGLVLALRSGPPPSAPENYELAHQRWETAIPPQTQPEVGVPAWLFLRSHYPPESQELCMLPAKMMRN